MPEKNSGRCEGDKLREFIVRVPVAKLELGKPDSEPDSEPELELEGQLDPERHRSHFDGKLCRSRHVFAELRT